MVKQIVFFDRDVMVYFLLLVLNLIKYDKTQTGRNSLERLLMAKNEEENENISEKNRRSR